MKPRKYALIVLDNLLVLYFSTEESLLKARNDYLAADIPCLSLKYHSGAKTYAKLKEF